MTTQKQLYDKVSAEYAAFIDRLKSRTPDEIINAAYEKVCKEETVAAVERGDYSDAACAAMSEFDNLLDVVYMEWLSTDATDLDKIETVINELAEKEAEHMPEAEHKPAEIIDFPGKTEPEPAAPAEPPTPGERLYNKLSAEYDSFIKGLEGSPPKKIIESAYEKVFKEDILLCFEDDEYRNGKEIAALLALDKPLDELYRNWLDTDVSYMDDLRDTISGFTHREAERQFPNVETARGRVGVGDWVLSSPDGDYGCLVGQVTAIEKLRTPEHDAENETDDVHADFFVSYSDERIREIEARFSELYGEEKRFAELPLDDVIMAPETLISLVGVSDERIGELSASYAAAEAFYNGVIGVAPEPAHEPKARAINGELDPGDWVIVKPGADYACHIGQVREADPDGVTVTFAAIDYTDAAKDELRGILGGLYQEPLPLGGIPLGGAMIPPENLISLVGSGIERTDELADTYIALCDFGNRTLTEHFSGLEEQLVERLEQNLSDYNKSMMGFGKRELIDMAAKIAAMQDMCSYMTTSRGYSDEEVDFYMQFANPLEVAADAWVERNADNDDMSFALDHVFERRGELLAAYPLARDTPADEPPAEIPPPNVPKQKRSLTDRLKDAGDEAKAYNAQKAQDPATKNKTKNNKEEIT